MLGCQTAKKFRA